MLYKWLWSYQSLLLVLLNTHNVKCENSCVPVIDIKHKEFIHNYNSNHFYVYYVLLYIVNMFALLVNLVQIQILIFLVYSQPFWISCPYN